MRAVCAALGADWYEAYDILCEEGRERADLPSADATWGRVLLDNGFSRRAIPVTSPDGYTAGDFAYDHGSGIYVLAFGGHVATVRDGVILDSWDSSHEVPVYYYKRG